MVTPIYKGNNLQNFNLEDGLLRWNVSKSNTLSHKKATNYAAFDYPDCSSLQMEAYNPNQALTNFQVLLKTSIVAAILVFSDVSP